MNVESKHTPGPWRYSMGVIVGTWADRPKPGCTSPTIVKYGGLGNQGDETEANARLIAAAPELLEALDTLLDGSVRIEPWNFGPTSQRRDAADRCKEVLEMARAAIAKATGSKS